jgi:hypothetical protein
MEGDDDLRALREFAFATQDQILIRYRLIGTFSSVEEFNEYLRKHPETRGLYLMGTTPSYVHCYLNFVLQREDNADDLFNIAVYALVHDELSLLQSFPAEYNFFEERIASYYIPLAVGERGYIDILNFLIERGLLNHPKLRDRCLCNAVVNQNIDAVRPFLDGGVSPNIQIDATTTLIMEAVAHSSVDIIMLLVSQGADLHRYSDQIWFQAAIRGDGEIMNFLHGMNVPMMRDIIRAYLAEATLCYRFYLERLDGNPLETLQRVLGLLRRFGAEEPESLDRVHLLPRHRVTLGLE